MTGSSQKKHLRSKQQIGSCKMPINFKQSETVFHHDDIPPEKRKSREDVKQWNMFKILGDSNGDWNNGTAVNKPLCERRKMENFVFDRSHSYQYNYRAEVLPPKNLPKIDSNSKFHISAQTPSIVEDLRKTKFEDKTGIFQGKFKQTQEMPVNPKLEGKTWNHSTEVNEKAKQQISETFLQRSYTANRARNTRLFGTSECLDELKDIDPHRAITAGGTRKYISPIESVDRILEEVRRKKKDNCFSTKYTVFQKAVEPVDRKTFKNQIPIEPKVRYKVTEHTGRWEYNAIEERHMWSDTGSFEYESRGDKVTTFNPTGYNYVMVNGTQPKWELRSSSVGDKNITLGASGKVMSKPPTAKNNLVQEHPSIMLSIGGASELSAVH